jgi:DNA-binding MarR family transcriptional regulator
MTEPVRWLDEDELAAWHPFVIAGMHLFNELDRDLRTALDVSLLDHAILLMLRDAPDPGLTMGHLAGQFGVENSVITYRLQRMEQRGLARRERNQVDKRLVHAVITPAGEALCDAAGPTHVASVRGHFLDHVPRPALAVIADVFGRLHAAQQRRGTQEA